MFKRNRILRTGSAIRQLVAENRLSADDFIVPLFIVEGEDVQEEIPSMPNYFRRSLDLTLQEIDDLWKMGLKAVLLFVKAVDDLKDNKGTEALNPDGLMQRSIRGIKARCPEMVVMTDVALDPYSSFGHDGIVEDGKIVNDPTVEVLAKMALSHAQCGADFVAPSDMMDGRIKAIRETLEQNGFAETGIMSYSAKYASAFYGPFRDALDSAPGFGDKKTYQMNPANSDEALREIEEDILEGADIIMVKPGMPYLDIVYRAKTEFNLPVAVYQVSGEYAMIKAAAKAGWLNERETVLEATMGLKRAGADLIASYFAKDIVRYLKEKE